MVEQVEFRVHKLKEDGTWVDLVLEGEEVKEVPVGENFVEPRDEMPQKSISEVLRGFKETHSKDRKEKKSFEIEEPIGVFDPRPNSLIARVRDAVAKIGWDEFKVIQELKDFEKDENKVRSRYLALRRIARVKKIVGLKEVKDENRK